MIKIVMQAIADADAYGSLEDAHERTLQHYSFLARAAIEAMREPPTDINVSAVYEAIDRADPTSVVGPEALLAAWQAMIDEALGKVDA